jgi:hypothetical protein
MSAVFLPENRGRVVGSTTLIAMSVNFENAAGERVLL